MKIEKAFRRTMKFKKVTLGSHKILECKFGVVSVDSFEFADVEQGMSDSSTFLTFHNLTQVVSEDEFNIELTYNILN